MAPAAEEAAKGGLPQFDPSTFESQVVWLVLTLLALYFVISRIAIPRVQATLEAREDFVAGNLDKAARDKSEADDVQEALERALAGARSEAQSAIADAKAASQAHIAEAAKVLDAKLAAQVAEAEERIAKARTEALGEIAPVAIDAAVAMVARVSGSEVDAAKVSSSVANVMKREV